MSTVLDLGGVTVRALSDGTVRLPPSYYPGLDVDAHPELLHEDRTYHIPAGCFLVEGDGFTILVDAGLGPVRIPFPAEIAAAAGLSDPPEHIAEGGLLPGGLAEAGVAPGDVTAVFLTHLDADHVGWIAPGGELYFADAEVICSAIDLAAPPGPAPGEAEGRRGLAVAKAAGRLREVEGPTVTLAPGVVAHHTPGHTPGHYAVSVTSGGREAWLLGDAIHHPLQLGDATIACVFDQDGALALRTREALVAMLEPRAAAVGFCHRPGLEFRRIAGRSWAPVHQA